jgi:hypothetical protein
VVDYAEHVTHRVEASGAVADAAGAGAADAAPGHPI